MNRTEELLLILSEECAEVAQAASKCIRFGMEAYNPTIEYCDNNREALEHELGDFMAMFKLLIEESELNEDNIMKAAEAKLIKVEKFMRNGIPRIAPLGKQASFTPRKPRKNKPRS